MSLRQDTERVEEKLRELLAPKNPQDSWENCLYGGLFEAMRYSLLCGGKRIRPALVLEFCRACGGDAEAALPYACALEMIHTYSLIHDDLPCMDNDDMRRGNPACHVRFGEDTALLAGDALLTMAFETMLAPEHVMAAGTVRAAEAAHILARAAGANGMVGGQVIDLASEGKRVSMHTLSEMDRLKTGALIEAAAAMGCVLGGAERLQMEAAARYAQAIGLAFQIEDDILDVTSDNGTLGKPVGSDTANEKSTYVSLMGLEVAQEKVRTLTNEAVAALEAFDGDTSELEQLAERLALRKQ